MLDAKKIHFLFVSIVLCFLLTTLSLGGCNQPPMRVAEGMPVGFSNVSDVPIPETAEIDMANTTVVGGHDRWTGQLSYIATQSRQELIDFINSEMQKANWTKISELRGKAAVFSFIKESRVAVILVTSDKRSFSANKTLVSIGMTNSKLTMVDTKDLLGAGDTSHSVSKCHKAYC